VKLARFGAPGAEKPALVEADGTLRDLSGVLTDIDPDALSDVRLSKIAEFDVESLPIVSEPVRLGPPVARTGKIVCIGLNYTDHVEETGLPIPTEPVVFLKGCHPNDTIRLPKDAQKADWEVELAIVIGKLLFTLTRKTHSATLPATAFSMILRSAAIRWSVAVNGQRERVSRVLHLQVHGLSPATK
jgi:2-keto-4-pentenoate hydratase/2-oxohepta-3-ene-1,7-dioic acid hydratase in catechol pathway